jgi:oligopeptide/dipeptide ABC transporter ATP-binding protein
MSIFVHHNVGKLVEMAETEELFESPLHPYTEALMSAVPKPDPRYHAKRIILEGDVADPANTPSGCYFHPRCRYATDICSQEAPELRELRPDHFVSCHRAEELSLVGVTETTIPYQPENSGHGKDLTLICTVKQERIVPSLAIDVAGAQA